MSRSASAPWPLRAAGLASLAAALAALLSAFAALVALAGLRRLGPGVTPAAAAAWLWYFRGDPQVRRWLTLGALCALGAAASLAAAIAARRRPPLHGAARWAREGEIARAGLRARHGLVLGRHGGRLLVFGGTEHVLLYAPTRAGKGVGVVIPNLLTWPDSVVVLDVKGENWAATAGFRAAHGQQVFRFDPLEREGRTARFNPLGHVARDDPAAVLDELQKLAVMLFPAPDHADPFWAEAARTGFIGVGAWIAHSGAGPFSLGAIYAELTAGDPRRRFADRLARLEAAGRPLSPGAAQALGDFCSASENTFASIKQTITARMGLWLNPRVCAATEASDFDLAALRDRRISLYLCTTPDNLARVAPLYALLFQQMLDLNTRETPRAGRHAIPVLLLLDEFARLGAAESLARAFAFVAGYGLRLLPVLQSPAQLRAAYGADLAEEIVANCGVEVTFAPKALKLAQELSERLGAYTYASRARSRPTLLGRGSAQLTESEQRRALRLPQELVQMADDQLIVLRAGVPPILGRKITYWRERAFARRVQPPPVVPPRALPTPAAPGQAARADAAPDNPAARTGGLDPAVFARDPAGPPPPRGASVAEVEAWVDRFIDTAARGSRRSGSDGR